MEPRDPVVALVVAALLGGGERRFERPHLGGRLIADFQSIHHRTGHARMLPLCATDVYAVASAPPVKLPGPCDFSPCLSSRRPSPPSRRPPGRPRRGSGTCWWSATTGLAPRT